MSVISFGPNQQLNQQQRTAYQTSQKVKQAAWETSHRMAALNNTPADNPTRPLRLLFTREDAGSLRLIKP